jgi:putative peptidoglycan lipid II flippase
MQEEAAAAATGPTAERSRQDVSELAGHSRTVVGWTVATRLTGFLRVALLAAVLGPTFFGNLVQTALVLPYLVCQLLMASLVPAILTPHLVRLIEAGERERAHRLACSFFGVATAFFGLAAILTVLAAPLLLPLLTLAVGDPAIRAAQIELGWYLVLCLAPQVPLFGIAAIGLAVQQAHRRFALSTAAPAFENLGFGLVLGASAVIFGVGGEIGGGGEVGEVSLHQVVFLGLGATLAVALHGAAQWWGARRVGMPLWPRGGWLAPELRLVLRMAVPSSGNAILVSLGWLAMLIVAGGIPGGAVAFQVAYNLFNLPIALCARPIATAQLPLLARRIAAGGAGGALFHDALRLTLFVALPAILVFLALADQLATLVTFGGMRTELGLALVAAAILGLGFAILGESIMVVATSAAYARHDAASPFRAMALQTGVLLAGLLPVALLATGPWRLTAIGFVFSAATLAGGLYLYHRQLPAGRWRLDPSLWRDLACAVAAVAAGVALATLWPSATGILAALSSLATAGLVYLVTQWLCRSNQLALLLETVRPSAAGPAAANQAGGS